MVDASSVYVKTDIDDSDKVVAAALASINQRVYTLESSSGGTGGGIDLQTLDASLRGYTYDKARIDASYAALDASMGYIYDYAADVSVRVGSGGGSSPDLTNYYTKTQSDTSIINYTYSKSHIDASISAATQSFVVMSESDYELITPNPSTLYFLT